jgi:hypothetical protein
VGPDYSIERPRLYNAYRQWCLDFGRIAPSDAVFGHNLRACRSELKATTRSAGNSRERYYAGIIMKGSMDHLDQEDESGPRGPWIRPLYYSAQERRDEHDPQTSTNPVVIRPSAMMLRRSLARTAPAMRTPTPTNESWPTTVPAPAPSASDLMPQSVIGVGESFRWSRAGHGVGAPAYENQEQNGGRCGNRNHKLAHIVLPLF